MPALAFGLKPGKSLAIPAKRKAFNDSQDEASDNDEGAFGALKKPKPKLTSKPNLAQSEPSRKSPKLSTNDSSRYTNLSALRSAKLQDEAASSIDASVYDYDAVYDSLNADKNKQKDNSESGVPKYMTNLLASADVRKRDQLRAKEKQLQRERDAEGDEFVDKEKFVTGAYKKQQEEMRRVEEEERQREEMEEERRRKGGGMTGFHKDLLRKDEERQRVLQEAVKEKKDVEVEGLGEETDQKIAEDLNEKGANVVVNDDGEIVDKRQLLSAGLNVAPKKVGGEKTEKKTAMAKQEWQRTTKQQDARLSQRERQSRMMEKQIKDMEAKQKEIEAAEQKEREEKNKSKLTEDVKLSAKERYLQRKKQREEEEAKAKGGGS